jgi:hypothetical protein
MGTRAASLFFLSGLAMALAACSHDNAVLVNPNIFPANYKQQIIRTLQKLFVSNETVRVSDAFVSEPALSIVDKEQRYTACIRYTAHGVTPLDIGHATRIAYFYGGNLNQLVPATGDQCSRAQFQPFLELDQVCLGKGCK